MDSNIPFLYVGEVKVNEWADLNALFGTMGIFQALNDWAKRDRQTLGSRTLIMKDEPKIGIPIFKPNGRSLEFRIVVKNPQCCDCGSKPLEVTAKQVLFEDLTKPEPIIIQEFKTPNAP